MILPLSTPPPPSVKYQGIMHECVCPEIIEFYGSFLGAGGGDVNIVME